MYFFVYFLLYEKSKSERRDTSYVGRVPNETKENCMHFECSQRKLTTFVA